LRDTGCLPSFAVHSERPVVGTINTRENILEMVQRSPRLSTRRMASRIGLSRMQVWRTLHEEHLYP
jgi:predicted ArsR family transcriptional regulator